MSLFFQDSAPSHHYATYSADALPICFTGQVYTVDKTAPTVSSINRADTNPTNASSVHWTVTFSESSTGVDSSDFSSPDPTVSRPLLITVTGSGSSYTVTPSTGTGKGS